LWGKSKTHSKKKSQKTPLSIIMLPTRRRDAFASSTSAPTKDGRALFPKQCGNARDSSFTASPKTMMMKKKKMMMMMWRLAPAPTLVAPAEPTVA